MDDPNEENIETNWVMINSVDLAEEATVLDFGKFLDENEASKTHDNAESDIESDGISIISESSHLQEGSNEDENLSNNEDIDHNVNETGDNTSSECASEFKVNWTFVDSGTNAPEMATSNQFYLNCLQEPVQELSEHELGSVQSDADSDGISIISDCDSLNDFTEDEKKIVERVPEIDNYENEESELASKLPSGIKKYCNGVLIGTILLATSSIFLGHYFNSVEQVEEDLPIYKEDFSNDLKETLPENIKDFKEKYEVPTALAYCQERHKEDEIFMESNVKKCLNKIEKRMKRKKERDLKEQEINKINKYLKVKQQYLEEKEKFLIKREYELIKAEMKLKNKRQKKNKKHERGKSIKMNKNAGKPFNNWNEKPIINIIKKKNNYKKPIDKDVGSQSKYEKFIKKRKEGKPRFLTEYHKSEKNRKEHILNKSKKKDSDKKYMKNKSINEAFAKSGSVTFRNVKASDTFRFEDSKENRYEKKKDKGSKDSTNYIVLGNKNDNETVSGYWVGRLYKGRSDMRNKRHSGDWYFDRASYRKTKRDKAKWYFDWMMDRELLRYRRSFYM